MKRVLVAVVTDEDHATMLANHPRYEVVYAALSGTRPPVMDPCAPVGEGQGVSPAPLLYDYDTVAALLHLSERKVRQLVTSGELPAVTVGRARRVRAVDLDAYVEHLGAQPQQEAG